MFFFIKKLKNLGDKMAFFRRDIEETVLRFAKFPVVAILGPRQSGKTTLVKHVFSKHVFIDLDDLELRTLAIDDPKGFFRKFENEHGIILDEFQNCPDLLSYIKVISDAQDRPGYFILTGSQNFLVNEAISQSLAGRVGILTLLPLSLNELKNNNLIDKSRAPEEVIFKGFYPRVYKNFEPEEVYPSYINTYVERDIRLLTNIENISTFQKFIKLCAARVGQLVNYSDLAVNCGISVPTVKQWLSILEASYIIFLLKPHFQNFNKRITKTPKLYFYDTGLVCSLLEINSSKNLLLNPFYGHLFECMIISDLYKQYFNQGKNPPLYFWRDQNGLIEVDCIVDIGKELLPIEIKSGETYNKKFLESLDKWNSIAKREAAENYLIYAGTQIFRGTAYTLLPWDQMATLVKDIISKK